MPTRIGFENHKTGEVTCEQGPLRLLNCSDFSVFEPQHSASVDLQLTTDFSAIAFRSSLLIESISHVQRFPLLITTDMQVVELMQSQQKSTWTGLTVSLLFLAVTLITFKQAKGMQKKLTIFVHPKDEKAAKQVSKGTMETNATVEQQYKVVSDKFKQHN